MNLRQRNTRNGTERSGLAHPIVTPPQTNTGPVRPDEIIASVAASIAARALNSGMKNPAITTENKLYSPPIEGSSTKKLLKYRQRKKPA
jgi:hypothetical protein